MILTGLTLYKVHDFAAMAGVTVRALHHYDRFGLLKPVRSKAGGYRLYSGRDFARLEQIVVLKFLGLPLKEIRELVGRESGGLRETLRRQRTVLAARRGQLDAAILAIARAETTLAAAGEPDWTAFTKIIKEIAMQNETEWSKKYYSEEAREKVEEQKALWSPELQERVSRDWASLFADVESALGEDPESAKAQQLAARWKSLVLEFTGGDREIQNGLNRMYADQDNWPEKQRHKWSIKPEIQEFISRAMRAASEKP